MLARFELAHPAGEYRQQVVAYLGHTVEHGPKLPADDLEHLAVGDALHRRRTPAPTSRSLRPLRRISMVPLSRMMAVWPMWPSFITVVPAFSGTWLPAPATSSSCFLVSPWNRLTPRRWST